MDDKQFLVDKLTLISKSWLLNMTTDFGGIFVIA